MQKLEQPTGAISVSDPLHVAEIFANGPINLIGGKEFSVLTFTAVRADTEQLFVGSQNIKQTGVVVARIALPNEALHSLYSMLGWRSSCATPPGARNGFAEPRDRQPKSTLS
jgi:hypothetical protein